MGRIATTTAGAAAIGALALFAALAPVHADVAARALPAPALDQTPVPAGLQTAVFAGGCFWGVQGVFQHVAGVTQAVSGYAGGKLSNPDYEQVSSGTTGHAESVRVTYDPNRVSYGRLLQIFFSVALDPTQVDRQGPDYGTQYRSETLRARGRAGAGGARLYRPTSMAHTRSARRSRRGSMPPGRSIRRRAITRTIWPTIRTRPTSPPTTCRRCTASKSLFPQSWQEQPVLVGKALSAS